MGERQGPGKNTGSKAARKTLQVLKFLGAGNMLEWKSVREVAKATGLTLNEAYGALGDLVAEELAEKSAKGFRQSPQGLSFYAVQVQEELAQALRQLGISGVQAGKPAPPGPGAKD